MADSYDSISSPVNNAPAASSNSADTGDHYADFASPAVPTQAPPAHDYQHDADVVHGMIAGGSDKASIMKYATDRGLQINESDLNNALSYRERNGNKAANAVGVVVTNQQQQVAKKEEPKVRPDGVSKGEAFVTGALESIPGADRIGAAVDAGLKGTFNPFEKRDYSQIYNDSLAQERGLSDQSANEHPGYYYGGMVAGTVPQLLIPGEGEATLAGTMARGAAQAGTYSLAGTRQDLSTGEGWKNAAEDATKDAAIGATVGAVLHGGSKALGAINTRGYAQDVLDAADRQGITLTPGHVSNGPIGYVQRVVSDNPFGGFIRKKVDRVGDAVETKLGQTADNLAGGQSTDLASAAERNKDASIPGTLADYEQSSRAAGDSMYSEARNAAAGVQLNPTSTVAAVDKEIARLSGNKETNAGAIQALQSFRNDLATNGGKSVDDLRNLRESLFNGGSFDKGTTNMLYKTLTNDIQDGLTAAGKSDAVDLFKTADGNWRSRRQVLNLLKGTMADGTGPEPLANMIERLAGQKGDSEKLGSLLSAMSDGERSHLQAAYINSLGRMSPGRATEPGEFSLNTFLTNYQKMSPRARDLMFRGQVGRDLADLATVAGAQRKLTRKGSAVQAGIIGLVGGGAYELWHDPIKTLEGGVGTAAVAALLAAPGGARLLARMGQGGRMTAPVVSKAFERIARRVPGQASEILGLRDLFLGNSHPNTVRTDVQAQDGTTTGNDAALPQAEFDQQGNLKTYTDPKTGLTYGDEADTPDQPEEQDPSQL